MSFIDLSHDIVNDMSTYPTDPNVSINRIKNIKNNNSLLHQFKMGTHTGTHLDVPAHILENGKTLDNFSIDSFCGKAVKVDFGESDNLDKIDNNIEGIILNTGWYKNFNKPDIFYGKNRPKIPRNLIDYVLSNKLKFFCCDLPSVDSSGYNNKPIHEAILGAEIIIYESLTNLDSLPSFVKFDFYGFPLSFVGLDGSPVRAIAKLS